MPSATSQPRPAKIALVWENFGPSHADRINACSADIRLDPIAIELFERSDVYAWDDRAIDPSRHVTLAPALGKVSTAVLAWRLVRACRKAGADAIFLCHYNFVPVWLAALMLRASGKRVIAMIDSKFDDMPRRIGREAIKWLMLRPYHGALVGSRRSADYLRFLGFSRRPVRHGFDSLSISRLRQLPGPTQPVPHAERDFLIVARLVPKKNIALAIAAFATMKRLQPGKRRLRVIGYGDERAALETLAENLGVAGDLLFEGRLEQPEVIAAMRSALALVLPSTEEQFGLVVIEALAQGLPVIVSSNAGAVDELIDNGANGWVIDPYRPEGLVAAMSLLDRDEATWRDASVAALGSAERGDVRHFVEGVAELAQPT